MVIKESQLNDMMSEVLVDMQQYLNKFNGGGNAGGGNSNASTKNKVTSGESNIDPIKVLHATILGVCHFQSLEGSNIKTNITEAAQVLEMNLSACDLNCIVVEEFRESLI